MNDQKNAKIVAAKGRLVPKVKSKVAVKIIDMLGEEALTTQDV